MTPLLSLQLALVSAGVTAPDPEDVKPGWLGFGVFLALAAAVVLLWLSMRRQLKKVDFEEEPDGDDGRGNRRRGGRTPRPDLRSDAAGDVIRRDSRPDDGTPHTTT
jgi:hypothetical protein